MTEAEWLVCTDPVLMVEFLRGKVSERKLRLFAVACCRRLRHLLVPEASEALDIAERNAEGSVGSNERKKVREMAFHVGWVSDPSTAHRRGPAKAAVCDALARRAWEAAAGAARRTIHIGMLEIVRFRPEPYPDNWSAAEREQADMLAGLLRCISGNPFRNVNVNPSWLAWKDCIAVKLAQSIYDNRGFDRLPTLADILEEAGCRNTSILDHCRQSGPHVRGCWVVDNLTGKQ